MIRKPTDKDFAESTAVVAMRESRKIASEGSSGLAIGIARAGGSFLLIVFIFTLFATFLPSLLGKSYWVFIGVLAAGRIAWNRARLRDEEPHFKPGKRWVVSKAAEPRRAPVHGRDRLSFEVAALVAQATTLVVQALLLFMMGAFSSLGSPAVVAGIVMMMLAVLLVARVPGDRTALTWTAHGATAKGLIGEGCLRWADVADVRLHTFSHLDLIVLFLTGSRHCLVIRAAPGSDGPARLLVPVEMLDADRDGVRYLAGEFALRSSRPTAAAPAAATSYRPPEPRPAPDSEPLAPFDADAIMARYLDERRQIIAEARPDLAPDLAEAMAAPPMRRTFGRKVA